jgi:hypothetical protein
MRVYCFDDNCSIKNEIKNNNINKSNNNINKSNNNMNNIIKRKYSIGLIIAYIKDNIGSCFGLKNDALLYEKYLKGEWNIYYISPYTINDRDEQDRKNIINKCNIIIGFEEMGDIKLINYIKNRHDIIKILIPNLEVMDKNPRLKWYDTLTNIDMIDIIINKADCLETLIEKFIKKLIVVHNNKILFDKNYNNKTIENYYKLLNTKNTKNIKILNIGHITFNNDNDDNDDNLFIPEKRMNIIHFAGSSSWKNTYENCLAGLEILERFNLNKLIIKITSFKNNKFNTHLINNFDKLMELCNKNKDKIELIMNNVITENEKAELYKSCRLALCCSYAEGFGHYIMEAAYYGCLIITTNGIPMNCLLTHKNTYELVEPISKKNVNYGIKYITKSNDIVIAANRLNIMDYNKKRILDCIDNYNIMKQKFKKNISIFSNLLKSVVDNIKLDKINGEFKSNSKIPFNNNIKGSKEYDSNTKYNDPKYNNTKYNDVIVRYNNLLSKKIIINNPLWITKNLMYIGNFEDDNIINPVDKNVDIINPIN